MLSVRNRSQRIGMVGFHLYEMPRIGKYIEVANTADCPGLGGGRGGRKWGVTTNGYGVSY